MDEKRQPATEQERTETPVDPAEVTGDDSGQNATEGGSSGQKEAGRSYVEQR